jgi:hypothetical protein
MANLLSLFTTTDRERAFITAFALATKPGGSSAGLAAAPATSRTPKPRQRVSVGGDVARQAPVAAAIVGLRGSA